ncbi:hypothetical protein [Rossellomorea aquimaris]|uniref:hypothetical protein n=1 Tax=Rossellomorea aquimaris TaxID=189382 RepID=UPI001CFEFC6F|nr:hypothetical protein [Rossellomorea aquimaris]
MGFLKSLGKGAGELVGGVTGGVIKGVGELTGSNFIKEVGDGVKQSTEFAGKQLGNVAEGVWNVGSGMVSKDDSKIDRGFSDIGDGVSSTAKAVGQGIHSTAKSVGNVAGGIMDGDEDRWKKGLRNVGKTVAVGALGVSILDVADVVDINGNEGGLDTGNVAIDNQPTSSVTASTEGEYIAVENPNDHGVAPHWVDGYDRADGTYVEGYWRDGDGDTSVDRTVEEGGGYSQSNPDYRVEVDKV